MTATTKNGKWCDRCGRMSLIEIDCKEYCLWCDKFIIDAILSKKTEPEKGKEQP